MKSYYRYAENVKGGTATVGRFVYKAVERFYTFLDRDDLEFRESEVDFVIEFIKTLKHFKNRHAGQPFILEDWQAFCVANIYGFYYKANGLRVCQNVYIEIARKNGKTALAGALALYHMIADGVSGAEVDLAANSKEQAKISFEFASKFSRSIDKGGKLLDVQRDRIFFKATDSKMHVFASDSTKLDGFGASAYILDEFHASKDTRLRDVLQSSSADRENPIGIIITTAGADTLGPCYQYREVCVDILEGLAKDDKVFSMIFALDDVEEWTDPNSWIKCNPNLGRTVTPHFLQAQVTSAKNDKHSEGGILTKNFNLWIDTAESWISPKTVRGAMFFNTFPDFVKPTDNIFVGVDLSATSDLTAVAYLIPRGGRCYFFVDYYLPEEALTCKPLRETYKSWLKSGDLIVTPGNVVDYDFIINDLIRKRKTSGACFRSLAYDPYNATQFIINATREGFACREMRQNLQNFNRPTKELERLTLTGKALFNNNMATRFCFRNVRLKRDHNDNVKPDKSNVEKKIDGVIAMLQALNALLQEPVIDFNIS